jgi:hypothetical protein
MQDYRQYVNLDYPIGTSALCPHASARLPSLSEIQRFRGEELR